ncbi:MAG TPA: 4Fe-4S dicluster domain-containing protein [Longimicrobium sp.]
MFSFWRRKPEPVVDAAASRSDPPEAPGTVVTIVGSGAVEPVRGPLPTDGERMKLLARGYVESVENRCVQCGICSYNCPTAIDVRSYSRRAMPVLESHCILCGECVARCPRGVLRFHLPDA